MGTVQSRHLHPRNPALAQMSYYSQGKAQMDDADEGSGCCVGLPSSLTACPVSWLLGSARRLGLERDRDNNGLG